MNRKIIGCITGIVLGVIALVAMSAGMMAFVIPPYDEVSGEFSAEFSIIKALSIVIVVFLTVGVVAGLIGGKRSWIWGICIVVPTLSASLLSLLFAGPSPKTMSNDIPLLSAAIIFAVVGSYIGGAITLKKAQCLRRTKDPS